MSDFNTPKNSPKAGTLIWSTPTYGIIKEYDQPYYTYQGIGSLTGQNTHLIGVTFNGIQVTHENTNVTYG